MTKVIAVAGKGGTGKTTFSALAIRYLVKKEKGNVLAVDIDPNSNLNEALGIEIKNTVAKILELTQEPSNIPIGYTKQLFIENMLASAISKTDNIDLLVMGGPQGPGCYCYPNDILKLNIKKIVNNYNYVVLDTEAGLEHISRGTIEKLDYLYIISDGSVRGVRSAKRIYELVKKMKNQINNIYLVVTKIENRQQMSQLELEIKDTGIRFIDFIPYDKMLVSFDLEGKSLFNLPDDSLAVKKVEEILKKTIL